MAEKEKWSYQDYKDNEETLGWDAERNKAQAAVDNLGTFQYNTYTPSEAVNSYTEQLSNHNANKVADWTGGTYGATLNDLLNQINNREKFSYDLNGDALYQQYKDQYMTQGNIAMMDTMGQAAAATGGYGNSYAQTVGQQTYQGYLQQLNDRIPELYQMALNKYNMEGDQLLNQYNVTSDAYNKEYGEHRDSIADWENERSYLQTALNNERNWDYTLYSDRENQRFNEFNTAYTMLQDTLNRADSNYWDSRNFGYSQYSNDRNLSYTEYQDGIANQLARDQLKEQMRANEESEKIAWYNAETSRINANKTTSSGNTKKEEEDEDKVTPYKSKNTNLFQASIKTKHEYLVRGGKASGYNDYVYGILEQWYEEGKLDDGEAAYLMNLYGF